MYKNILFYALIILTIILSFIYMPQVILIARNSLELVLFNLFPTLFPFMCLLLLALNFGLFDVLGHLLYPLFSFLHLSKTGLSLFLSTLLSGYPTNITLILQAFNKQKIGLNEAYTLIKCASFASPSFILVTLQLPFNSIWPIYVSHLLPSLFYLIFFHRHIKDNCVKTTFSFPKESFVSLMKSIFKTCLYPFIFIYGFILVFRVLSFFLGLFLSISFIHYLQPILEFSSGLLSFIQYYALNPLSTSMIAFFLSFSGLSVIMQCDSLLDQFPHSLGMLVKYRFIHGITSFIFCFILLQVKLF